YHGSEGLPWSSRATRPQNVSTRAWRASWHESRRSSSPSRLLDLFGLCRATPLSSPKRARRLMPPSVRLMSSLPSFPLTPVNGGRHFLFRGAHPSSLRDCPGDDSHDEHETA